MHALLGKKIEQSQRFLEDGTRIPVTALTVAGNPVVAVLTVEKNGYSAVQLGFGVSKKPTKSLAGNAKKANLTSTPHVLREIKVAADLLPEVGSIITVTDVFKPGDVIQVTGVSKGKGWAGVVKRHHFRGGPRTHGQSDRERAPGSIGQTTTPGRVYKGKRMAGRMGHEQVTVTNLTVVDVTEDTMLIAGLVPGPANNVILVTKTGERKNFVPLYADKQPEAEEPIVEEKAEVQAEETVKAEEKAPEATVEASGKQETVAEEAPKAETEEPKEEVKEDSENAK